MSNEINVQYASGFGPNRMDHQIAARGRKRIDEHLQIYLVALLRDLTNVAEQ